MFYFRSEPTIKINVYFFIYRCYIGMRKPAGGIITNVVSGIVNLVFISNVICYLSIWLKIRQIGHRNKKSRKYTRTTEVMMLFVLAYLGQWWSHVICVGWSLFSQPHFSIMFLISWPVRLSGENILVLEFFLAVLWQILGCHKSF